MENGKSFEQTYPSYPFPRLVEFGLALSGLFILATRRHPRRPEAE